MNLLQLSALADADVRELITWLQRCGGVIRFVVEIATKIWLFVLKMQTTLMAISGEYSTILYSMLLKALTDNY